MKFGQVVLVMVATVFAAEAFTVSRAPPMMGLLDNFKKAAPKEEPPAPVKGKGRRAAPAKKAAPAKAAAKKAAPAKKAAFENPFAKKAAPAPPAKAVGKAAAPVKKVAKPVAKAPAKRAAAPSLFGGKAKKPFTGKIVAKPVAAVRGRAQGKSTIKPAAKGVSKQRGFKFGGASAGEFIFEDGLTGLEAELIKRGESQALTGAAKLRFFYNQGQGQLAKGYRTRMTDEM